MHRAVLLREAVTALAPERGGIYVDCTFGRGGHTQALLQRLAEGGRVIAIDKDPQAVAVGRELAAADARLEIIHGDFAQLGDYLAERGLGGQVDGILMDLGVSSPQLDDPQRGFSFQLDGPLDMRMDPARGLSAAEWLAAAPEAEIVDVLFRYGEERFARRIARAIVRARQTQPLRRTGELVQLVIAASPKTERHKHPATRTFQALRIFVNRELEALQAALQQAVDALAGGGRLAVISFHSLEDRLVKRFLREQARGDRFPTGVPVTAGQMNARLKLIGKAQRAGADEVAANPRARSAVLRVAECL